MDNIISINPSIKLKFYQAHLMCNLRSHFVNFKPNVYINVHVNISGFTESFNDKIKQYLVQNLITAFNCKDEIPLDDKYGNHHT